MLLKHVQKINFILSDQQQLAEIHIHQIRSGISLWKYFVASFPQMANWQH